MDMNWRQDIIVGRHAGLHESSVCLGDGRSHDLVVSIHYIHQISKTMAEASQIIHDYFRKLATLVDTFSFVRHGHSESMGKDAAGIVAEGIVDRSASQQRGAYDAFPANDSKYTDRKRRLYNVDLIGFRTGQMISLPSLLGHVDVTPDTVTMTYGTDTSPSQSMSSSYISTADQAVTDTQKAQYFTQLKGDWYAIDEPIADKVRTYFADQLNGFIRELNAR